MDQKLLAHLKKITAEEQELLQGSGDIQQELYTSKTAFVIDSQKLLEKGRLIEIRPHTRFAYFPRHRHDYVEMVYMCSGSTTHIINGKERIELREGDLLFLNQTVYHEILPTGEDDIAVNFIILPAFFDRAITMIERENVLRDFLLSTLSSGSSSSYLHIPTKDIVPVQNLIENMIWTLIYQRHGTNTLNQTTMGLLFLNLSLFAERINQNDPDRREQALVFSILKYIESHYKSGTLAEISASIQLPTYTVSRLLKRHTGLNFKELLQKRKLEQRVPNRGDVDRAIGVNIKIPRIFDDPPGDSLVLDLNVIRKLCCQFSNLHNAHTTDVLKHIVGFKSIEVVLESR